MSSAEDKMNQKQRELKTQLAAVNVRPTLSDFTIRKFCIGFHLPLTGTLYYLMDNTTAYRHIQCFAQVQHGKKFTIKDFGEFDIFSKEIENITAPVTIDFTFNLSTSVYVVHGTPLNDINVMFSVYFFQNNYEVVYDYTIGELRFSKAYNEDLEPEEILALRDKLADEVFTRVAKIIDASLNTL